MRAFLYAPSGINRTTSNLYRSTLSSLISLSTNRNYASTRVVRLRPEIFLMGLKSATLHCAASGSVLLSRISCAISSPIAIEQLSAKQTHREEVAFTQSLFKFRKFVQPTYNLAATRPGFQSIHNAPDL